MKLSQKLLIGILLVMGIAYLGLVQMSYAAVGTIDPVNSYAWSENIGWINFGAPGGVVTVTDTGMTGYAWSESHGWINLQPPGSGVTNDVTGNLGGQAWGENIGYIDFVNVSIDAGGFFQGYAGNMITGQISFNCANTSSCGSSDFKVQTDWIPPTATPRLTHGGGGGGSGPSGPSPAPIYTPPQPEPKPAAEPEPEPEVEEEPEEAPVPEEPISPEIIEATPVVCGNDIVQTGEQCDDGNTESGDGCSETCQLDEIIPEPQLDVIQIDQPTREHGLRITFQVVGLSSGVIIAAPHSDSSSEDTQVPEVLLVEQPYVPNVHSVLEIPVPTLRSLQSYDYSRIFYDLSTWKDRRDLSYNDLFKKAVEEIQVHIDLIAISEEGMAEAEVAATIDNFPPKTQVNTPQGMYTDSLNVTIDIVD